MARFEGFPDAAFTFYEGLAADNSKTYWLAHKDVYEEAVRAPVQALAAELEPEFGTPRIFRPYRDVRFSRNKAPYKTEQGVILEPAAGIGYYFAVSADGLRVAAGFYHGPKDMTVRYRAAVDTPGSGEELRKITGKLAAKGYEIFGDQVRTRPRGVPADHPRLELMRYESVAAARSHPPAAEVESRAALTLVRGDFRAMRPFVEWVVAHVGPAETARR